MNGIEYLLDTNIIIGLLKGHEESLQCTENVQLEQCALSQITRMELLGFPKLQRTERTHIEQFIGQCHVLLLDESIEKVAIDLRAGGHFKLPDAIIAATAIVHKLQLVTLDQRLYKQLAKIDF